MTKRSSFITPLFSRSQIVSEQSIDDDADSVKDKSVSDEPCSAEVTRADGNTELLELELSVCICVCVYFGGDRQFAA